MGAKTFSLVAGLICALVALLHLVRIFEEWPIIIGDWSVPKSVSWVAVIVAGGPAQSTRTVLNVTAQFGITGHVPISTAHWRNDSQFKELKYATFRSFAIECVAR